MTKKLLLYEDLAPLSSDKHRDWSIKTGGGYEFARTATAVPLIAVEFALAAVEFPIVFARGKDEEVVPLAIMGVRPNENLFVKSDGTLSSRYVPAFLRRYPFVFASAKDSERLTLCIDESFEGCNQENRGERLFDAEGEQTAYLKGIVKFQSDYHTHFARTQAFCKKLEAFDLLEEMGSSFRAADGRVVPLAGFLSVSRKKLHEMSGDKLEELSRTGELDLAYAHLHSLATLPALIGLGATEEAT